MMLMSPRNIPWDVRIEGTYTVTYRVVAQTPRAKAILRKVTTDVPAVEIAHLIGRLQDHDLTIGFAP